MTSPAYRVVARALERLLSPRVASSTLRMAMEPDGLTPETIGSAELEAILKGPVFRQLQVAMPPDRAKAKVKEILAALPREADAPHAEAAPAPVGAASPDRADPDGAAGPSESERGDTEAPGAATGADPAEGAATERPEGTADAGAIAGRPPEPARAPTAAPTGAPTGTDRRDTPDAVAEPGAPAPVPDAPATSPDLDRLRDALRPYNLYFEWPEVRRLRAQLVRIEEELAAERDVAPLLAEADETLATVRQKLEDRLVLQARELAGLDEALEEVEALGGPKVRRLASLVKRVRDAQEQRQLADAEIERGAGLARDLRKLMASSVYQEEGPDGGPDLEERLKALDVAGESDELDRLARDEALLLEHRDDLAERLHAARARLADGATVGAELTELRDAMAGARRDRIAELRAELADTATRLDALEGAWTDDLLHEHDVLAGMLDDGLPHMADVVRYRDLVALAVGRAERADRHAEEGAAAARARLDAQGARLARAQQELLRYGDDVEDAAVDRLRVAVDTLRLAQAEERIDDAADGELRAASEALAAARRDSGDAGGAARAQVQVLLARLDGLPSILDPSGARELSDELRPWLDAPPEEAVLAAASAAVADAVAAAHEQARVRLERVAGEASAWSLSGLLDAVRDANERLEDGADPDIAGLERRLDTDREEALRAQLDRLHRLERDAERLSGIDDDAERSLSDALARARAALSEGRPAATLDTAGELARRLASTLDERVHGVMPRLDAALTTFATVERLNSDDVATVRRILRHLDSQRDAFERVSPSLRARMERSLQDAEELLEKLVEEERATREIADQLMAGNRFDDLLGLFGDPADAPPTGRRPGADDDGDPPS